MRRALAVMLFAVGILACNAQSAGGGGESGRVVWDGGLGHNIIAVCDSQTGNLIYAGRVYGGYAPAVVPGGCK